MGFDGFPMRTYELLGFRNGRWEIQASYESREDALIAARNAVDGNRFPGIRVTEEVFDVKSQLTRTRSIFSYEYSAALDRSGREEQKLLGLRKLRSRLRQQRKPAAKEEYPGVESSLNLTASILYLFAILALGVFSLIALHTFFSVS